MTAEEYREALERLDLSQAEVGRLLLVGDRTSRRWALGETPVPGPVEMHIRQWLEIPEHVEIVRRIAAPLTARPKQVAKVRANKGKSPHTSRDGL